MKLILYILIFLTNAVLLAQPTGERKFLDLDLSFKDKAGNLIYFDINNKLDSLSSEDKNYKLISYTKKYFYHSNKISLDCFFEEFYKLDSTNYLDYYKLVLKDSISIYKPSSYQLDSTKIRYKYFPSYNRLGTKYFVPESDLIIKLYNQNKLMIIHFEIYKIHRNQHDPILIDIPFKEGVFKVIDPSNPELIKVKD